ncbi:MAG TPA: twin-arginine translocase subunit TatC [Caulobacteraceae bacterium]|jgi:sec-independent protein translocase protein TatC|nr:twin-arginine translocase subunit TatC [Caulobacteraceae bacterium]
MSNTTDDEHEIEASRAPLMEHLIELRRRLIISLVAVALGFIVSFFFVNQIITLLVHPSCVAQGVMALRHLPGHESGPIDLLKAIFDPGAQHVAKKGACIDLISTAPLETFFTKIKVAMFGGIMLSFPILAFQLYRFVAPGLYRRERNAFLPFLIASPILFVMGAALVYFVMLPFILWFSLNQQILSPQVHIQLLPKISDYLDLVTKLLLAFGLCFQLPVVLTLVGMAGLIQAQTLAKGRRYAAFGIIVVSCIVTPPDMISPFLLALPIYALYEASIWCVRLIELRRKREQAAAA